MRSHRIISILLAALLLSLPSPLLAKGAKNIILFIGDGMGPEQVKAGRMYMGEPLSFEVFGRRGLINTSNLKGETTDSAAAATAIATGKKALNKVISFQDMRPHETILEHYKSKGKSVGLVTTAYLTHATPAAFAAHVPKRDMNLEIAHQYLAEPLPEVLMGGSKVISPAMAERAGYYVVTDRDGLYAPDTAKAEYLAGLFGRGHMPYKNDDIDTTSLLPQLKEMVGVALDILDDDPDGLFLMVEAGRIDHASHANDIRLMVGEVEALSEAVEKALEWIVTHPDTLLIITADHETGGLWVIANSGAGVPPKVRWASHEHTSTHVPIYGRGPGAENIKTLMENTEIYEVLKGHGR